MRISPPNYTQAPNELFDEWLPHLGMAELKVLMVILRKTFGWHKVRDRISLSQLEKITGLERRHVSKGIKGLIQKKLISKIVEGKKGEQVTYYELIIIEDSNNLYQCPKDTPPSVLKTPTKETLTKERKENIIKEKPTRTARQPAATPISLSQDSKRFEGISLEDMQRWRNTFPAVNLDKELAECLLWALSTPRKNYRKSIDTWLRNVQKTHTTAFKEEIRPKETIEVKEIQENERLANEWALNIPNELRTHYSIDLSKHSVLFVIPGEGSYSVRFDMKTEEFKRECYKALQRMRIKA